MRRGTNQPLMREYNQTVILDVLRRSAAGLTRAEVARSTGLSPQTVTNVSRRLIDAGFIREGRAKSTSRGRPGLCLEINPEGRFSIGVHLDPAQIIVVCINLAGVVVARHSTPTPQSGSPTEILDALVTEISALITDSEVDRENIVGIGIATPGPVDTRRGLVINPPHLPAWHNVPLRDQVSELTGFTAVLEKDVIAAAAAHLWYMDAGVRNHVTNALFGYLGTGVAMSPIVAGDVVRGLSSNAGEVHHMIVDSSGPLCECGQHGCFGAVLSAGGLIGEALRAGVVFSTYLPDAGLLPTAVDQAITELCDLAGSGDAAALAVLAEAGVRLARATGVICDLLDLDTVIIGGATWSRIEPWVGGSAVKALARRPVPGAQHAVTLRTSPYGQEVAAIGAACRMLDEVFSPRPTDLLIENS